jgi:hypothetical protein
VKIIYLAIKHVLQLTLVQIHMQKAIHAIMAPAAAGVGIAELAILAMTMDGVLIKIGIKIDLRVTMFVGQTC